MKKDLRFSLFTGALLALSTVSFAQSDRFAYAITDLGAQAGTWNALRKLDLGTGAYSDVLLNGSDAATPVYDALSKKKLTLQPDARYGTASHAPFSTGVAAAAFDRRHNRLYYTPMFIDQLRYIDLATMKVHYLEGQAFSGAGTFHNDEAKAVTRMVITPNGDGYALSNDGNTFLRFSTGKKPKIESLGTVVDDPANGGISIHNRCTSFGGDAIADDKGNLYILTARNNVFYLNTENKVAKHLGVITGLPEGFTVNGAVVDADGKLLVSSAMSSSAYYVVNPSTWEASLYAATTAVYRSSDLANSNFLGAPKASDVAVVKAPPVASGAVSVFPNPVVGNTFTLQFGGAIPAGDYSVTLADVTGRRVLQKQVSVGPKAATHAISTAATSAKGIYLLRVTDKAGKAVLEQKVLIQ